VDQRLKDRDMGLELLPAARTLLSERGYDPVAGARPLRRDPAGDRGQPVREDPVRRAEGRPDRHGRCRGHRAGSAVHVRGRGQARGRARCAARGDLRARRPPAGPAGAWRPDRRRQRRCTAWAASTMLCRPDTRLCYQRGHLPRREKPARLPVAGHRDIQSAAPPVLPAGASPGSTVLPGTIRLPPAAWVTLTRRAWVLGDAGMVTCRTPSA
jgi:C-terminal, D2-small domain, of ClpB protein